MTNELSVVIYATTFIGIDGWKTEIGSIVSKK